MIESISKWASSIAVSVIIVTILEMLLPEGKNKKYIKTVMGIYIVFVIISPIAKTINGYDIGTNIESLIDTKTVLAATNNISIDTSANIENIYLKKIKEDISEKVKQKGYAVKQIDMEIETNDEERYGEIYKIDISINKVEEEHADKGMEKRKENNKSLVEKIEINIGNTGLKKELSNGETITKGEIENLKEYLSETYCINKQRITIKEAN